MGLFDFVKDAGKRLFGDDEEEREAVRRATERRAEAEEAAVEAANERRQEQQKGKLLEGAVHALDLPVENLQITFDDGTARIRGTVPDQRTREKVVLVVGNTHGVSRVDEDLQVTTAEPEATFYTVKKGDTLSAIAREQYGDASKYRRIFEANRPMLEDPDLIYPGQVLRIPEV